jgi:photosystem II oxygen-evolving enhancer protein 2
MGSAMLGFFMSQRFSVVAPWRKALLKVGLVVLLGIPLLLGGCGGVGLVSLNTFTDPNGLYSFSYPNGMIPVEVPPDEEAAVIFRDLIFATENVNLMISEYDGAERITDVGSPAEVGQRVADKIIAPPGSGRTAELVNAGQLQTPNQTYYLLEFKTTLARQHRHDVVAVTIARHKLFTLTASTLETRWPQVQKAFLSVAESLRVA